MPNYIQLYSEIHKPLHQLIPSMEWQVGDYEVPPKKLCGEKSSQSRPLSDTWYKTAIASRTLQRVKESFWERWLG